MSSDRQFSTLPPGHQAIWFDEVCSTNTTAFEQARAGAGSGLWVIAGAQHAGRGSRGRDWVSQKGNLFASLLLRNRVDIAQLSDLTFVAVLAVANAISAAFVREGVTSPEIALKWPNDVLIEGQKVSGILLENHVLEGENCVIVGFGINLASHPASTLYPATDLACHGLHLSSGQMLEELAGQFARFHDLWQSGVNFERIRQMWLDRARGIGEPVRVSTGANKGSSLEGIMEGIDARGALVLRQSDGTQTSIRVGDVFFGEVRQDNTKGLLNEQG